MHVPNRRGQDVNSRGIYVLPRFLGSRKALGPVEGLSMDFRAGSDITDLSLHEDVRVDCFKRFYRGSGLNERSVRKAERNGQKQWSQTRSALTPTLSPKSACGQH